MKRTRICVVTGSRAEYGILYPVLCELQSSKWFKLQLVVTYMHLMREFGNTYREIERDGFRIDRKIPLGQKDDSGMAIAHAMGTAVQKFAEAFNDLKPDCILVVGDRPEVLAVAFATDLLGIPIAQIHAGERSGHIDGVFRHAITKLSHIFFVATARARARVLALGEEAWRVHIVGAPALDRIRTTDYVAPSELAKKFGLDAEESFILVVQHPVQHEDDTNARHMRTTLDVATSAHLPVIVIYPNADSGSAGMIRVIKQYARRGRVRAYANVSHREYLGLLGRATVLVGNSSSALIEAPSFGLPAVSIGSRQEGREAGANVLWVGHDAESIRTALRTAIHDKKFRARVARARNPYGNGQAAHAILKVLRRLPARRKLLSKRLAH